MIKKKIYPAGEVQEKNGEMFMEVAKTITECRVFGILLYKKEIINPRLLGAAYWDGFYPNP